MTERRLLLAVAVVCLLVAAAAVGYGAGKASDVPEVIRAQRFEVVDSLGRTRAVLETARTYDGNEEVSLSLVGRGGGVVAKMETQRFMLRDSAKLTLGDGAEHGPKVELDSDLAGLSPAMPSLMLTSSTTEDCSLKPSGLSFESGPLPPFPRLPDLDEKPTEERIEEGRELVSQWQAASSARKRIWLGMNLGMDGLPGLVLYDQNGRAISEIP